MPNGEMKTKGSPTTAVGVQKATVVEIQMENGELRIENCEGHGARGTGQGTNCELPSATGNALPFRIPHFPFHIGNLGRAALVIAAIWLLAGCGSPEPQPLILGDPVWQNGERSSYRVTNREDIIVGTAQFEIQTGGASTGENWIIHRQIVDVGISEAVTVEVAARGYIPVVSTTIRTQSQGQQVVEATHNQAQIDISLTNQQGATVYERVNAPSDVRDERTLLPLLRTLPLRQGYATFINSFSPLTGLTERFAVRVLGSEAVTVPAGVYETWVVEAKTTDRTTRAWIAKDAPFTLVKFIEGRSQATFELTDLVSGNS